MFMGQREGERKGEHLASLTGVRFFAALWVVVFHQRVAGGMLGHAIHVMPAFLANVARTGYAAVGVFFVLSGFILAYTYRREPLNRRDFWAARVARIYPTYLIGLLLAGPMVLLDAASRHQWGPELAKGAASLLLVQAWDPRAALSWNGPGWSLSAEAFFYLLFPFLLVPVRHLRRPQLLAALAALGAAVLVVPAACVLGNVADFRGIMATDTPAGFWCDLVKFNPLIRLPEFVFGVLLGRLFLLDSSPAAGGANEGGTAGGQERRPRGRGDGARWYLPGLALFLLVCATLTPSIPYPFIHNNVMIGCVGLMLYGLARGGGVVDRFLRHPLIVKLGEASYATYIIHVPLADWMLAIDKRTLGIRGKHASVMFLGYVVILLLASLALYKWVEEPARRYLRRRLTGLAPREAVPPSKADSSPSPGPMPEGGRLPEAVPLPEAP